MRVNTFEELEIWKKGVILVKEIYILCNKTTLGRDFELKNQIVRAVVSIPSNIAEGFERNTNPEFKRFLLIAKGSVGELRTQLFIAKEVGYISEEDYSKLNTELLQLSVKIGSLIRYLRH